MRRSWKMKRYQNLNFNRLSRQFRHGAGNYYLSQNSYNKKTRKSLTENLVWLLASGEFNHYESGENRQF